MNTLSNGVERLVSSRRQQSHDRQDQSHTRVRAGSRQCVDGHSLPCLALPIVPKFLALTTRAAALVTRVNASAKRPQEWGRCTQECVRHVSSSRAAAGRWVTSRLDDRRLAWTYLARGLLV